MKEVYISGTKPAKPKKVKKRPKDCPYDDFACRVYHFCGKCIHTKNK